MVVIPSERAPNENWRFLPFIQWFDENLIELKQGKDVRIVDLNLASLEFSDREDCLVDLEKRFRIFFKEDVALSPRQLSIPQESLDTPRIRGLVRLIRQKNFL